MTTNPVPWNGSADHDRSHPVLQVRQAAQGKLAVRAGLVEVPPIAPYIHGLGMRPAVLQQASKQRNVRVCRPGIDAGLIQHEHDVFYDALPSQPSHSRMHNLAGSPRRWEGGCGVERSEQRAAGACD